MQKNLKELQNRRKQHKRYSSYFCFYFTCLGIIAIIFYILFGEYQDGKRVHTELHLENSNLEARVKTLEAKCLLP